jgi:hypothetical protein
MFVVVFSPSSSSSSCLPAARGGNEIAAEAIAAEAIAAEAIAAEAGLHPMRSSPRSREGGRLCGGVCYPTAIPARFMKGNMV